MKNRIFVETDKDLVNYLEDIIWEKRMTKREYINDLIRQDMLGRGFVRQNEKETLRIARFEMNGKEEEFNKIIDAFITYLSNARISTNGKESISTMMLGAALVNNIREDKEELEKL